MFDLVMMFRDGGPFMYAVVGMALVGWIPAVLAVGFAAFRFRVPAAVWLLGPVGVLLAGALGTWYGLTMAKDAIAYASLDLQATLAAAGLSVAMSTDLFARALAAPLLLFVAWLAAIGHVVGAGDKARWTPVHALAPAAISVLVAIGATVGVFTQGVGLGGLWIALVALLGGLAVAVSSVRGTDRWAFEDLERAGQVRDDAGRLAAGRMLVALCAVAAVWEASSALTSLGILQAFGAVAFAAAEMKAELLAAGIHEAGTARWVGGLSAIGIALGGLAAVGPIGQHLGHWRTGLGLVLLALVVLPLLGLRLAQGSTAAVLTGLAGV